ncbi:YihY/virulence factor BrkB family protein [Microbacterium ulmi]|uniref:YihY/virulence factor BrkB family protein n=1 Tax=Microbacterium ulmi TaxID=179095 RepID=A0A7Y2LY33_9MICO|nr:YihY/virulence factor BrkB family protein [Microbacterium ulmi]NII70713.1 membrane protein [Microbacterium ulmi]NNH02732.1 YihY/virulence factor BrkB family protein [Microbacterium ulmi]
MPGQTRLRELAARATAWALTLKPVRAFLLYTEHRGPVLADSVTYRTLFSVFAGVLLGFSLAAIWLAGNPTAFQSLVDAVNAAVPGLLGEGDEGLVDPSAIPVPAGLTIATIVSLIGLVGSAMGAIASLRTALHVLADNTHDDVLWVWVILRNLALAIGIGAALGASAAVTALATTGLRVVSEWLGQGPGDPVALTSGRIVSILVVFALDAAVIAVLFLVLSGVRASARSLWSGALLGAVGLTVLQELSSLFVGGAASNPLLVSFAALIALLLWLNLSAQVILIASAYIIVGVEEEHDRVRARHGASTFAQRRVRRAEEAVRVATEELQHARGDEERERSRA